MIHGGGDVMLVGPCPTEEWPRTGRPVHRGQGRELTLHLHLAGMAGQIEKVADLGNAGHVDEQVINGLGTDH